jgi:hypothetical protein
MFKRLIAATDLSPASFAVVSCLEKLKAYGAEQCLLLQCLSFSEAASTALSYHTDPLEKMLNEQKTFWKNRALVLRPEPSSACLTPMNGISAFRRLFSCKKTGKRRLRENNL